MMKFFSEEDTTNWSQSYMKLQKFLMSQYRITALSIYQSDNDEALLKMIELSMKENKDVKKALNIN